MSEDIIIDGIFSKETIIDLKNKTIKIEVSREGTYIYHFESFEIVGLTGDPEVYQTIRYDKLIIHGGFLEDFIIDWDVFMYFLSNFMGGIIDASIWSQKCMYD